ncbi:hypothetical protein [Halarchaeum sp. P4]|uniref:hypothetical protein n=1 Tax=Halarchaeum sp. P4 TaxID=3421639 RepID=UPI003EBB7B79
MRDALRDTLLDVVATAFAFVVALASLYVAVYGVITAVAGMASYGALLLSALAGLAFVACVGGVLRLWRVWPFS